MAVGQASFLQQRSYLAVGITHFFVDILNSSRNLLVAILAISIGLTNAQVGIALLLYNVGNSLSQPLFGLLADRVGARWLVVGGMGWMMVFYGLAALVADWPALIALTVAGVGSGAFHPTGTMVASKASQAQRTQATALFFMSGQLGLFAGPILAGMLLEQFGRPGYLVLPAVSFIAFASGWQWLLGRATHLHDSSAHHGQSSGQSAAPDQLFRRASLLSLIILAGSTVSIGSISFAPKLFTELGYTPAYVGWLSGLFMMGSAFGGVTGGWIADRRGGKSVILLGAVGVILPIFFYIPAEGIFRFALLLLAGFFGGMPHSILILMAQSLLPGRQALASGLALGFMFFSGSVGSFFLGIIADTVGLATALQGTAALPLIAVVATLLLPKATSPIKSDHSA
jgi:FSR family fosmidomycin resistance protein-like MFS transporter